MSGQTRKTKTGQFLDDVSMRGGGVNGHDKKSRARSNKENFQHKRIIYMVHPDFHGHFTFWTKSWDQVRVSLTKSFLELSMAVNLLLSNPT